VVLLPLRVFFQDRIVGELLQPAGARSLERMGLEACLNAASVNNVTINGYVVVKVCVSG
jgi:hypothetical protein